MIIRMLKAKRAGDKEPIVWGTGKPVREWAYIDDFVNALYMAKNLDNVISSEYRATKRRVNADSAMMIKEEMSRRRDCFLIISRWRPC